MKILIPSPVLLTQKNKLITYVYNLKDSLSKKTKIELVWMIYQPDRISDSKYDNDTIFDIHDFNDAVEVLEKIKPDCILTNNNSREPIAFSFILASKYLKKPLIYYYLNDLVLGLGSSSSYKNFWENARILIRRFFANKIATDSEDQKQFMRRGRFFGFKNIFLMKTRIRIGVNPIIAIKELIRDYSLYFRYKKPIWNNLGDLYLCSNLELYNFWTGIGIDKEKLVITGSPYWDKIFHQVIKRKEKLKENKSDKIRVLLVTGGLVEHGVWTYKQREVYLKKIFQELKKNQQIVFNVKIHPASESFLFYTEFIKKLGINIKIYQHENLLETMYNYDIILSYGYSTIHTECAYAGIKMILLDVGWNFKKTALVDEALKSGFFLSCASFENIGASIVELNNKEIKFDSELIKAREKLAFKFDGKAGERASDAIIQILKNQN